MPLGGRALLALLALSRTVEMAGRNTARDLDLAFWHADSREFEGEAASIARARAVWGPFIVQESARSGCIGPGQPCCELASEELGRVSCLSVRTAFRRVPVWPRVSAEPASGYVSRPSPPLS